MWSAHLRKRGVSFLAVEERRKREEGEKKRKDSRGWKERPAHAVGTTLLWWTEWTCVTKKEEEWSSLCWA